MSLIYTRFDWRNDRTFKAAPGQEIEEEIYEQMLNCMPPHRLPRNEITADYIGGFLVGEPYDFDPETGHTRYAAFGRRDGKFYFIGYMPRNQY